MKKILILLGLISFLYVNAESKDLNSASKTYIAPSQVHFMEDVICIQMNDLWVQTTGVHVDDHGFYIDSYEPLELSAFSWRCPKCGKNNENYRLYCVRCGYKRP